MSENLISIRVLHVDEDTIEKKPVVEVALLRPTTTKFLHAGQKN